MGHLINELQEILSTEKIRDQFKTLIIMKEPGEAVELLVQQILLKEYIYTTRDDLKSEMWIYKEGIYTAQGRTFIKEYVREILGEVYTESRSSQVISRIEADTFIDAREFFNTNLIDEICVQNGILNIITKELTPHDPKKIFFNKLSMNYIPNATCPNIQKHLSTVLKDESDIPVMQELIGFCLLKEYKIEKSFMLLGTGRNGKSKTLELIKRFLGAENCSTITLQELDDEFSKCELFNKMANLAGDIGNEAIKHTGWFTGLTGRDMIGASRKFLTKLYFVNYAKMIFSANDLPKTYDITPAFWNRWIILEFPYIFKSQKEIDSLPVSERLNVKLMDEEIVSKIISNEELSGLLNWSLIGLDRLLKNRDFSYSKSVKEVKDLWIRKSDSFMAFCLDHLKFGVEGFVEKKELRKFYNNYCKEHKIKVQNDISIKSTLDNNFSIVEDRKMFDGDWFHIWDGLGFKDGEKVVCKSCHLCHGFWTPRSVILHPIELEKGGKGGNNSEYENIDFQQLESILLDKVDKKMYLNDAVGLGFDESKIRDWIGQGLLLESPSGTIRLI